MLCRFIGDVHGLYEPYKKLIKDVPRSIQVGDMGLGFRYTSGPREGEFKQNPPHYAMIQGDHRFIRGNHDNPLECKKNSQWIADGTVRGKMMFIGGADSLDKEYRIKDYSWWDDEEVSQVNLEVMGRTFIENQPKIMVTHDCPVEVAEAIFVTQNTHRIGEEHTRTRKALQEMFAGHQPELWIFGHWHISFDYTINSTRFICLDELKFRDVEVD